MKQLKFDKDGFILPQKVSFKVEHEEETKEVLKKIELEKELLKGLKALSPEDRNIRSLTIFCNPNYVHGPDYLVQEKVQKSLKNLMDQAIVIQEKPPDDKVVFSNRIKKHSKKRGLMK